MLLYRAQRRPFDDIKILPVLVKLVSFFCWNFERHFAPDSVFSFPRRRRRGAHKNSIGSGRADRRGKKEQKESRLETGSWGGGMLRHFFLWRWGECTFFAPSSLPPVLSRKDHHKTIFSGWRMRQKTRQFPGKEEERKIRKNVVERGRMCRNMDC